MTYQKPINPQRFDEPVYEQVRRKKERQRVYVRRRSEVGGVRPKGGAGSRKSGGTKPQSRRGPRIDRACFQSATLADPCQPGPEIDTVVLSSVARQLMHRRRVWIQDRSAPVRCTSRKYLKIVNFPMHGREYAAIEQNAAKPSYWGQLARKGHEVVQFKDVTTGRFVAVAVDGVVKEYRWKRSAAERRSARTEAI